VELDEALPAIVTLTCATTPLFMTFVFRPERTHVWRPALWLVHDADFAAAEPADPTLTLTLEMSFAE
jgi:hypothetical protein